MLPIDNRMYLIHKDRITIKVSCISKYNLACIALLNTYTVSLLFVQSEPRGVVGVYHESDPCSTPVSGAGFRDVKISARKVFRC